MSDKITEKSTFSEFFKDDASDLHDITKEDSSKKKVEGSSFTGTELPTIPKEKTVDEEELKAWWRNLRAFFRSGKGGGLPVGKGGPTVFPALLAPYKGQARVRKDYPFWMASEKTVEKDETKPCYSSLNDLLEKTIESFSSEEGEAAVLKANVNRIVDAVRESMSKKDGPMLFQSVINNTLDEVQKKLDIKGDEGDSFAADIKKLKDNLPQSGVLIPFSASATFLVLGATLAVMQGFKRNELKREIFLLCAKLKDILAVEIDKSPEGKKPKKLKSSYDFADSFLNFDELSSVLPKASSELMSDDRFKRIEKVLKTLEDTNTVFSNPTILIQKELYNDKSFAWNDIFSSADVRAVARGKGCVEAVKIFEVKFKEISKVIAAMRIGHLELVDKYVPEIHGDYFSGFDWRSFTDEEMAACTPVVLVEDVETLINSELSDYSNMLSSNIPVKTLAVKRDARINYRLNGAEQTNKFTFQQELGALTVSHRNTFALQSTPVSPGTLYNGFSKGITEFSPALFYVLSPGDNAELDQYLWTSAAVEGREFPDFIYHGTMGSKWGSRFDISNNPQPEVDWPIHELQVKGKDTLSVSFTFADFAAQDSMYNAYLLVVPSQYWSDDLVMLSDYLSLSGDEVYAKVPYIWMVDDNNMLQKVAVSWPLVLSCKERLDFWQYIQENGGVNSYHVEQAMKNAREDIQSEAEKEIDILKEEHARKIEQVKDESANEAMEKLTAMLLDLDTASIVTTAPSTTPAAPTDAPADEVQAEEEPAAEEEDELLTLDEPWIETLLCTTCNECTDINNRMFNYNSDKMAFIADPKAGTFAEMVHAAEECPVNIIHPGVPLNPDEPDLDDLKKRAEKYN